MSSALLKLEHEWWEQAGQKDQEQASGRRGQEEAFGKEGASMTILREWCEEGPWKRALGPQVAERDPLLDPEAKSTTRASGASHAGVTRIRTWRHISSREGTAREAHASHSFY